MTSFLYVIFVIATGCLHFPIADACSSRSTPKPRPPSPTLRPNITIQTYTCPPEYAAHYCLNGATCFTVKIGESILYNCECAEGYMGQRCEFKDLDGSYLPSKQRAMLEQAGITSGVAIIVVFVIIVCFYLYVRSRRKLVSRRSGLDVVDTMMPQPRRPFSGIHNSTTVQQPQYPTSPPPAFPRPCANIPKVKEEPSPTRKMDNGNNCLPPPPSNHYHHPRHQHQHHHPPNSSSSSSSTKSSPTSPSTPPGPLLVKTSILPSTTETRMYV